jgi:TetR/AcrR family acrAB operon transcriptional repressor
MATTPTPPPVRPARLSAEARRESILDAALGVFAQHGYEGASTAEIAAACGCSEPVLYKHFSGKRDLFVAVLTRGAASKIRRIPEIEASDDPLGYLLATARKIHLDREYCAHGRLRLVALSMAHDPAVRGALRDTIRQLQRVVVAGVRRAQELGQLRDGVDPEAVARIWTSISTTSAVERALYDRDSNAFGSFKALVNLIRKEPAA